MTDDGGWFDVVGRSDTGAGDELDLGQIEPGDRLRVITRNTIYSFVFQHGRNAVLYSDRADRPAGPVMIHGCTFGKSTSIKPDHLFCGGSLEFSFESGTMIHRTSPIRAISLLRKT